MSTRKNTLFLVDVQNSFHVPNGSLAVPNSDKDAQRLSKFIRSNIKSIDRIVMTLDTHHKLHIAHPCFWVNVEDNKSHPNPFTPIKNSDVGSVWKPRDDINLDDFSIDYDLFPNCDSIKDADGKINVLNYCKEYTRLLEEKGKFMLFIWPEHCIIGSDGHSVVPDLLKAVSDWEEHTGNSVKYVWKGMHLLTESYSVFQAEVPVNEETSFNNDLFHHLLDSDTLWVTGQALSHCVNYSLRDLVSKWPDKNLSRIHLLVDCTSPVPSFEDAANEFVDDMKSAGIQISTSDDLLN